MHASFYRSIGNPIQTVKLDNAAVLLIFIVCPGLTFLTVRFQIVEYIARAARVQRVAHLMRLERERFPLSGTHLGTTCIAPGQLVSGASRTWVRTDFQDEASSYVRFVPSGVRDPSTNGNGAYRRRTRTRSAGQDAVQGDVEPGGIVANLFKVGKPVCFESVGVRLVCVG